MMPTKEPSIADLCQPLSAKVLPRSQMYSSGGREMSETVARGAQKKLRRGHPSGKRASAPPKT